MPLEIDEVAITGLGLGPQEMVKRYLVESCRRGKSRNMPADTFLQLVGAHYHGQGIPTHQTLNAALHFLATGEGRLLNCGDRVLIWRGRSEGEVHPGGSFSVQGQLLQQASGALRAAFS